MKSIKKIPIEIDLDELIEYREQLDVMIKNMEKINEKSAEIKEKLLSSGVSEDDLTTVFNILTLDY